jgi:hypothetical protein
MYNVHETSESFYWRKNKFWELRWLIIDFIENIHNKKKYLHSLKNHHIPYMHVQMYVINIENNDTIENNSAYEQ